jgi:DNA-binding PadR family transcriptional regulator
VSLDHVLLGILECDGSASGYELKTEFNEGARHYWYAELSQIYPTLKRLEQRGLLGSNLAPSERGPERRVYEVTDAGRAELSDWLRAGPHIGKDRLAYIAQILFMGHLDDLRETEHFLTNVCEGWATKGTFLRQIERQIQRAGPDEQLPDSLFHQLAGLRLGIAMLDAKVGWAEDTLTAVGERIARAEPVEV